MNISRAENGNEEKHVDFGGFKGAPEKFDSSITSCFRYRPETTTFPKGQAERKGEQGYAEAGVAGLSLMPNLFHLKARMWPAQGVG